MPIGCPQVEQEGPFSGGTHKFHNTFLSLETTEGAPDNLLKHCAEVSIQTFTGQS